MVAKEGAYRSPRDSLYLGLEPVPDAVGVPEGQGWRPEIQGVGTLFHRIMRAGFDRLSPFSCFCCAWC